MAKISVNDIAKALLEHARAHMSEASNGTITSVSMEISILSGAPGAVCKVLHHNDSGYPKVLLVPLTDYYKSTTKNKHIIEVLPLQQVIDEYDRVLIDAQDCGMFDEWFQAK